MGDKLSNSFRWFICGDKLTYPCNSKLDRSDKGWKVKSSSSFVLPESILIKIAIPTYEEVFEVKIGEKIEYVSKKMYDDLLDIIKNNI